MSLLDPNPMAGRLVHQILAQGYVIYLVAIFVGFGASYFWPETITFPLEAPAGMTLIILGTFLVYWAQRASGKTSKNRNDNGKICADHFCVGPYVFTRSPTQYGLFLMAFGLALLYGSFYMAITTVAALIIGKFVIIRKEEKQLVEKYGEPYLEYKKMVRF